MIRATTAVILARGLGTRMRAEDVAMTGAKQGSTRGATLSDAQRAAAAAGAKGLMPVGEHTLLDHVLHELADGGVKEVVFVVAPGESAIRARYMNERPPARLTVKFAEQAEPRGTADALLAARAEVLASAPRDQRGESHFLMLNADNLYPAESVAALLALDGPGLIAYDARELSAKGNIEPARVLQFALLDLSPEGALREIIEKPPAGHPLTRAPERWVSMNLWRFTSGIFDDCAAVQPSVRGELELADAVRRAIGRGVRFRAVRQRLGVLDLSRRGDVAAVEKRLAGRVPRP